MPQGFGRRSVRRFGVADGDPFGVVDWARRHVMILDSEGASAFSQQGVEAPRNWSDLAVATVARRYFLRPPDQPGEDHARA